LSYETIIFEKEGKVGILTLNRPDTLNAVNAKLADEVVDVLGKEAAADDVRVLVITGAGRGFCAGDDLREMGNTTGFSSIESIRRRQQSIIKGIRNLRKPVIAAINGNAHGMGSDIMLACDFRIASEAAKFGDLRAGRAITIGSGTTNMLPKVVGLPKAIELIFTGKMIDSKEAERIGLVNKTVPVDSFKAEVMELANSLAEGPTKIIGIAKAEIYRELNMDLAQALEDELVELWTPCEDSEEGRNSFLEKRPPKYTGK